MPGWTVTWPDEETRLRAKLRDLEDQVREARKPLLLFFVLMIAFFLAFAIYLLGAGAVVAWWLYSIPVSGALASSAVFFAANFGKAQGEYLSRKMKFEDVLYALEKAKRAGRP